MDEPEEPPARLSSRAWDRRAFRWQIALWAVVCLLNIGTQWSRDHLLLALWGAYLLALVAVVAVVAVARRETVVDADGIRLSFRRVPWSDVRSVQATDRWSPAEHVTVLLGDGKTLRVPVPAARAVDVARIGGVPYGATGGER